jgi:hypothetical protein
MENFNKPALIIGHPGHELRAFKFIKEFKPDVFIITNGSGSNNLSRINNSIKIIESLGAKYINLFDPFPDKIIYQLIREVNVTEIYKVKKILYDEIINKKYDMIIGDSIEGFNPTHDLCRYIINSIVKDSYTKANIEILNYSFDLDKAPNEISANNSMILFELNELELEQKINAAINYPELKFEVEKVLKLFSKEAFKHEYYSKVSDPDIIINWENSSPQYEKYGKERVNNGLYTEVIEFEKHMKPIAYSLLDL